MMSSLEVSSSTSASFLSAKSSQVSAQSTEDGESRSLNVSQSSSMMLSASAESSVSISNGDGSQLSLSTSAEFSLKFSQTTQMVIGQEGRTQNSPTGLSSTDNFASLLSESGSTDQEDSSLFNTDSLEQRIYEDNVALFDDYIQNNGGELTKENVKDFVDLMKQTIPEGFNEARSRLDDVGVMSDGDSEDLTGVRESVMDKLENFKETMIEKIENGELESLGDLELSDLPGVEGEPSNPFRSGDSVQSGFSLQLVKQTQVVIGRQGSLSGQTTGTSNASPEQSNSDQDNAVVPSFNADQLTNQVVEDNLSLLDEYLHAGNRDANPQSVQDFIDTIKKSINEGIDRAKKNLEELGMLTSENSETLETVRDRVMDRLEDVQSTLVEGLEEKQKSDQESGESDTSDASDSTPAQSNPRSGVYSEDGEVEDSESDENENPGSDSGKPKNTPRASEVARENANPASAVA